MSLRREAIEELPPETTGALTFHLPLELAALELAGADPALIEQRIARRLTEAYATGLVDPPLYRWAVEHYRPLGQALVSDDPAERVAAFGAVSTLGDGLAGAAFHGLIRLGYGLWRRNGAEVARGLAYLRTRRQVLICATVMPAMVSAPPPPLPPADQLDGVTVFDLMNLAAGSEDRAALLPPGEGPLNLQRLAGAAMALVERNPSSFVSVHTVTGLHGLCELHHAVVGPMERSAALADTLLADWWNAYAVALGAATVVMGRFAAEEVPAGAPRHENVEALLADAVSSGETHNVKLVLALRRLEQFGVLDDADVRRLGAVKLTASTRASR